MIRIIGLLILVVIILLYGGVVCQEWKKVGLVFLLLAVFSCYLGWTDYAEIRDVKEYEDEGVFSFTPYQVLPEMVSNSGKLKKEYRVYYKTTDGSDYKWEQKVSSQSAGEQKVLAGEEIEWRVLSISADESYIMISPEQTVESYVNELRQTSIIMMAIGVIYGIGYGIGFIVFVLKKRKQNRLG